VIKEHIDSGDDQGRLEAFDEMVVEAVLLSQVKPHGAVTTFFGVCLDPDSPACLVTELVEGGSLLSFISTRELTELDVLSVGRDLASALGHLQSTNILHCDTAARNCLVVDRGERPIRIKICEYVLVGND
jgi:serine/threonine protein kinase